MSVKRVMPEHVAAAAWFVLCFLPVLYAGALSASPETEALRQELELLRQRIDELEARLAESERSAVDAREAVTGPEAETATATAMADQAFDIGGALRFNYVWKDFDEANESKRGDVGLDLFRIDVDGQSDNLLLSAEYRFYTFMNTIHHGWIGYDFDSAGQLQGGITQVPFGLLPYASHNFWFGMPYYTGLADDYDLGVKYIHETGPWNLQLAAFKNAELGNANDLDRYSYDPVTTGAARNEQNNTLNARLVYTTGLGSDCTNEIGGSGMWGQLYNEDTDRNGDYWAAAAHLDSRCGRWNLQLEAVRYNYNPENPAGISSNSITFGAFSASHEVASSGNVLVANLAYNLPVSWPGIDLVTCYNDFSMLDKDPDGFANSYLNTTGCAVGTGPVFTYLDIIRGKNALFLGDGSLAAGGEDDWATRYNINLGYYW